VSTDAVSYFRIGMPALPANEPGTHAGTWTAVLTLAQSQPKLHVAARQAAVAGVSYDLLVHCYSALQLGTALTRASTPAGAEIRLNAALTEYGMQVAGRARVWAEVTRPDGSVATLTAAEEEPGRFAGSLPAVLPGLYTARIRASGATLHEQAFTREQVLTVAVHAGADVDPCARVCCPQPLEPAPGLARHLVAVLWITLFTGALALLLGLILLVLGAAPGTAAALLLAGAVLVAGALVALAVLRARG
jgi:hypothetical protein